MFSVVDFIKERLTLKIMLILTIGVALVMTTVISLSIKNQREEIRQKMTEFGRELGALAYAGIKHPMAVGDSASIEKELNNIQDRLQGAEIMICDFDQKIIFATDTKKVNTQISQHVRNRQAMNVITKALQTDNPGEMITFEEKEGNNSYLISMDKILNEKECHHCHGATRKVLGALLTRHSTNATYSAIAKLRNRTIAISLFGLGVILVFIYLVTRPLTELVTKAKQLARGDLTVSWPVKTKDSIGILGSAFNTMVMSIKDQIELTNSLKKVIAEPLFIVDLNMVITYLNEASALLTGYSREEVEGKLSCREILQCDICDINCPVQKTLKEGKSVKGIRTTIVSRHGQEIPTMASASVLKDSQGMVVGVVVVHTLIVGAEESSHDISTNASHSQETSQEYSFHHIISKNEKIQKIFSILPSFAKSDSTVLIEGASGSGKELFAKAIHELSERKGQFIALNCAALPDTLLESELFGYKKGAFTGAFKNKPGRFSLAENGTIFLDEIGDISPLLQLKLLRILQEKEFEPLGGTATLKANVRVIAATNKNLKELVKKNVFRKDLFFRLSVINISLPSLSERREDIPLLAQHFIDKFNILKHKNVELISARALNILMRYEFPGNVRELENIIEYCFAVCQDKVIDTGCLPEGFTRTRSVSENILKGSTEEATPLSNAEATTILAALKKFSGNRTKTAEYLGIDKTTLWRKMKKYQIDYPVRKN